MTIKQAPDDSDAAVDAESDVCVACGLCCNGAIFDYGPLGREEAHFIKDGVLEAAPSGTGFAQPCSQLAGTRCQIYADRPRVCSRYRCEVLNRMASGALSHEAARAIVGRAVLLVEQASGQTPGADIGELRRAFQRGADGWEAADPAAKAQLARQRLAIAAVERYLDTHFRRPHQRQLAEQPASDDRGTALNANAGGD